MLGAIEFVDIYQRDFNIDTLVVDGVSYGGRNVRMCLTEQGTHTWGGTFPTGLNMTGAEVLTLNKGGYGIQQFFAQDGFALRINFGSVKPWIVIKP